MQRSIAVPLLLNRAFISNSTQKVVQHREGHDYDHCNNDVASREMCTKTLWRKTRRCNACCSKCRNRRRSNATLPDERNDEALECAICLSAYQIGDVVVWSRLANGCQHVFHHDCIVEWAMNGQQHCPVCRTPFWSNDHTKVIQKGNASKRCRPYITLVQKFLGVYEHTSADTGSGPPDVIVEVHADETASNEPSHAATSTSIVGSKDSRANSDTEHWQFCILHGLIPQP